MLIGARWPTPATTILSVTWTRLAAGDEYAEWGKESDGKQLANDYCARHRRRRLV